MTNAFVADPSEHVGIVAKLLSRSFRRRRHEMFLSWLDTLILPRPFTILDLGGVPAYWFQNGIPNGAKIVCVNLDSGVKSPRPDGYYGRRRQDGAETAVSDKSSEAIETIFMDATDLSCYGPQAMDVVFSNSLIEHLWTFDKQRKFAQEVRRVGKNHFIQTPNRRFWLEPHYYFVPFWHFLPESVRLFLLMRIRCGAGGPIRNRDKALSLIQEIRLCDRADLLQVFPDSRLVPEKFGPFVKSWLIINP